MADNYVGKLNTTGVTFASDDIGGTHHPRVKVQVGPDGSAADLDMGQENKAGSLPVVLASDQDALPVTDNGDSLTVDDGGSSLTIDGSVTVGGSVTVVQSTAANLLATVVAGEDLPITDNGNSITVDGSLTVVQDTPADLQATVTPAGSTEWATREAADSTVTLALTQMDAVLTAVMDGPHTALKTTIEVDNSGIKDSIDTLAGTLTDVIQSAPGGAGPSFRVVSNDWGDLHGIVQVDGISNGQQAMAGSIPVVIASDQPAIPVTGSFSAEVTFPGSMAVTNAALGTTTDAAASSSVAEDTTARTGIGLLKAIKNILILLNGLTRGSGTTDSNTLRVITASDGPLNTAIGTTTDAAASSSVAEDATARTHTGLLKGIKNVLLTISSALASVLKVGGNTTIVTVTPTLSVAASYVTGDYVGTSGTAMTFALGRVNDGTGIIESAVLVDYAKQSISMELWLFDASVTPPNDSAAWDISDADSKKCIGVIPFSTYYASGSNSVAVASFAAIPFKCASGTTSIFGCIVTRGAPSYASGDVSIRLGVLQD